MNEMEDFPDEINIEELKGKDRVSAIKSLVRSLELRLRGYEWNDKGTKFKYTGNALAGNSVISKAVGLLQPFCEESNLITTKNKETFSKQKYEINSTFNATLLTDISCPASNYRVIMKMFKTTLQNIGDIILGSRNIIDSFYGSKTDEESKAESGW